MPLDVVYFSSVSGNTHRFVGKLDVPAARVHRIPLHPREEHLVVGAPYLLLVPTYGGGDGRGAVPKQVIRFLNDPANRALLRGVVGAGNTNFGAHYAVAGDVVAGKCRVPLLHRFEIFGTPEDVCRVRDRLDTL
ncbi:class Ib ribonucleoside-diphosphate reductase assembly flavoprotein NrdI [Kineococcus glutinatus]|uniref:Protein NrdI n=1 Tax=Kineococcus glutinatus TaxID=1070872 RepID=A0ABP9HDM6_9ACTN